MLVRFNNGSNYHSLICINPAYLISVDRFAKEHESWKLADKLNAILFQLGTSAKMMDAIKNAPAGTEIIEIDCEVL